jgi:hypothetical protein
MRSEGDARGCTDDQIVWATATANVLPLASPLRRLHDRV